jgi:hypothetical protein
MDMPALGRFYVLQNKATGFFLSGNVAIGLAPAHTVWATGDSNPRRWQFMESADEGFFNLLADGLTAVDRHGPGSYVLDSNEERQVYLMFRNFGSYQKWRMIDGGEGYWCLHNLATGFALDSNLDMDVYTQRPNDGAFQRWKFIG